MKIKLAVAAATTVFAVGAQAQSSVTLYGVVDAGVEYLNRTAGDHSNVRMQSGNGITTGSWWGLRGTEDLGGSLKGVFVLESGFNLDTGKSADSRLFNRQAFVGLQSRYGALLLGRQQTPIYDFTLAFDPMADTSQYSIVNLDPFMASRADNAIQYKGTFGGLTAAALYSFGYDNSNAFGIGSGEVPGNYKKGREYAASLRYTTGPFDIGAVYDLRQPDTRVKDQRASVAASYAFGPTKVFAGYRWENASGAGAALKHNNVYWLGLGYQATPALMLKGAVYYNDWAGTSADPMVFVATADYSFSKRTSTYLDLGYAWNRSSKGVSSRASLSSDNIRAGDSQFGAMVGVRHRF
ncbi:porin [Cupriavidus sp. D384]|uniref:porin n=1 Tax=Cupriavidus sp. D384 TaxID=1538095 RepID=UPI00082A0B38|nr:porin [Cupriavidus sp. D384]